MGQWVLTRRRWYQTLLDNRKSYVSIRRGPSAEAGVAAGVKTLTGVECGLPSTVFTVTPDTGAEGAASGDDQGAL